jgi:glucosamine-6-phosphate deaminase
MKLIVVDNAHDMGIEAARLIASVVRLKSDAVLGLATGSTPLGAYRELIRMRGEEKLDFSRVRSINLDEYIGLSGDHPQSYRFFMRENLFSHINIDPENTYIPDGLAADIEAECRAYDARLRTLGFCDLQLLGIGVNAHIAFNEPSDHLIADSHEVRLSEETLDANQRFFDTRDEVPKKAITMGMRGILSARRIVLLASGKAKAQAIKDTLTGPVTPRVPASVIQLHPEVTVIADKEALSEIDLHDYQSWEVCL